MPKVTEQEIKSFIEESIPTFHNRKIESLESLKLENLLKRKNPYLFRAKNFTTAQEFVKAILDAYLSSQEETFFGEFLEDLAIFICQKTYGGHKSSAEGIDLEFQKDNTYYLVTIKSGPNWGNSSQIRKMIDDFRKAKKILGASLKQAIIAVNGCCYGRNSQENKGDYLKLCGQRFWSFISDNQSLYTEIIQPLGHKAKEYNESFADEYAKRINLFTKQFTQIFCKNDGSIFWEKIVELTSSSGKSNK